MHNHSSHTKLLLAAVAGFGVLAAFGVPVLSYLPLLAIIAICPLMMIFMMRGMDHGGSNQDEAHGGATDRDETRAPSAHRH
jgi:tetrahydromethanopterin S-methyltransferase subunit E